MNKAIKNGLLSTGVVLVVFAAGLLYLSSQEWMFAPPQTWLFYHQTLIAGIFAVIAAIISIGGLWWVTERQIQHSAAEEQRAKNAAVSGLARIVFMDAANALEVCKDASRDLKADRKATIEPQTPEMLYPNFYKELQLLPGELGGSFLQMMNRFKMFEHMLSTDLARNDQNFPAVRIAYSHVVMLEACALLEWLKHVQAAPESSLTRKSAVEKFLTPDQRTGYDENLQVIKVLRAT